MEICVAINYAGTSLKKQKNGEDFLVPFCSYRTCLKDLTASTGFADMVGLVLSSVQRLLITICQCMTDVCSVV